MVRDRYLLLLRMIYFIHELGYIDDRLSKIRNIINMLRKSFILVNQYIPSKRNRFGIKSYMICDCKTGYVQDLIVYVGISTITKSEITGIEKLGEIILSFLKPYLRKNHIFCVDYFYSSPALFIFLIYNNCTNACVKK